MNEATTKFFWNDCIEVDKYQFFAKKIFVQNKYKWNKTKQWRKQ